MASNSGEGTKTSDMEDDMFEYLYEGIGAREEDEAKERSKKEKAKRKIRRAENLARIVGDNARLTAERDALKQNIGRLLKTARAELNRKNDRIAELKRKLDDVLFKRICATGKREEFADLIDNLRKRATAEFERLEIPGGTDKAPTDPLVVTRELKVLDGAAVSTVSMENMSVSVFKEGVGRKGTARLSAMKHGAGIEKPGRFKRRLETQDEIETSSSSSSNKKRPRLNVSDAPAKNIFKAVHGESNMERVGPTGKPVDKAREAYAEDKPVAALNKNIPPENQDPLRELNAAPNHKEDRRISENVRSNSKEKATVAKDDKATSSHKEAKERREVSRDDMVADRSRRDQKRGRRSELRSRSRERSGRSVDRKRPPPPPTSRSRQDRDGRGRERDRDHVRERRHLRYRREEDESERDGDRSRSRSRHNQHRSGHRRDEGDRDGIHRQMPRDSTREAGKPSKNARPSDKLEEDKKKKKPDSPETLATKPNDNGDDSTEEGEIFDEEEEKNRDKPQKEVPLESLSLSSSSRKNGRNLDSRSGGPSNPSRNGRQSTESSKNEFGTRSKSKGRSPERHPKSESSQSQKHRNSDSKESSKLISTEDNEKPSRSSSKCLEEKLKPAAKACEEVEVKKENVKSLVIPSPPPPPLSSPALAVTIVDAHSEEANDGFVDDNEGGEDEEEEEEDDEEEVEEEEEEERAPPSMAEPIAIPLPVSDMNSVDLHSMIEKKQKNLQELAEKAEEIQRKLKMVAVPSLAAPHSPCYVPKSPSISFKGRSEPGEEQKVTEQPKPHEPLRRSPRKQIPKLIVSKKFLEEVAFRSPSPRKQRKPRTESGSSTASPCSRGVGDLMATSSHSPSEDPSATGASTSSSPGCSTSAAGISQILRGKLVQGAVISPNSGMIRTPTPGHPNYSPSSHLKSSYPRPRTRSATSNSSEESTPPVEKSRKSSVTVASADNKKKQVKCINVPAGKVSGAEKDSKKSTNKIEHEKLSPKTEVEVKSAAKSPMKLLSHNSAAKTSPRSPTKRKSQAKKSPVKKAAVKPEELVGPTKSGDEVDSAEVTAADLGLDLTDDGEGIEVELAKVKAEDLPKEAVEERVKEEAEEGKGELGTKQEDTSSSSVGNVNTSGESGKVKQAKSEKHKKKKKKSKEEKKDKEERRTEKRMERERRRTQERVQLLKKMSAESPLFGMENQNVFDVRHDD